MTRRVLLSLTVLILSTAIIALFVESPPHSVLGKADLVGFAVCHRIPERSFILDGQQLPLCARCTGTFLGAMLGLAVMLALGRYRASSLPPIPVIGLLLIFMGLWAFDGLNSYLGLFPGAPQLYQPQNWLRLATGLLEGLVLIILVFPILNFSLWRAPKHEPVIRNLAEMLAILPLVGLLILVIQAQVDLLLYPLAIASSLGVIILLTLINTILVVVVLRREGAAQSWRQLVVPFSAGLALAMLQIVALGLLRAYLTVTFGLTF
ncbi:MAG: DUF2085 domain-containing protein [Anaerolineae bacterium]|nr:DUF2085 domain-containing protein [Anaerolineae bacterium]